MSGDNKDDKVGYGKPPVTGRFKKGQSGNPKGRPRKKKDPSVVSLADQPTEQAWRKEVYKPVTAKTASGTVTMPFNEALIQKQMAMALGGNRLVLKDMMQRIKHQEESEAERRAQASQDWFDIKRAQQQRLDDARRRGESDVRLYPHPDDIVRDRKTGDWDLVGPFEEEQIWYFEMWRSIQHLLLIWNEQYRRLGRSGSLEKEIQMEALVWMIENQLPPSYRLEEHSWIEAIVRYDRMSEKTLSIAEKTQTSAIVALRPHAQTDVCLPEGALLHLREIATGIAETLAQVD
ncbi:DUF5681 domain-containing protein [Asticcacaulis solisilvae]|uniref:DUF5681 domain-containing protein n=1 Tax=Asticcacaulis solisilvae TaxID=1217274 RepID=UPI003FD8D6BF